MVGVDCVRRYFMIWIFFVIGVLVVVFVGVFSYGIF